MDSEDVVYSHGKIYKEKNNVVVGFKIKANKVCITTQVSG